MKGRAQRRFDESLVKAKAKKICKSRQLDGSKEPTQKEIGKTASVHGVACSCVMCGNPRKFYGDLTRQERKMKFLDGSELDLDYEDQN